MTDVTDVFLDKGIMGAIILVLAGVVYWAVNGWLKEKDKRLEDAKTDAEKYRQAMGEFSHSTEILTAKLEGEGR